MNCKIGDWGLGIGDWGLGNGDGAQSPIPNPQTPIPILIKDNLNKYEKFIYILIIYNLKKCYNNISLIKNIL
jgi:hypothetical protein